MKPLAERLPTTAIILIITMSISTMSKVSRGLSTSIMMKVLTRVTALVTSWMRPWASAWRRVSTSLVNRLMMSPWVRLSK